MMINNFSYLKKFKLQEGEKSVLNRNNFYPVSETEINEAENRLGFQFPSELRFFFLKIGCGFLKSDHNGLRQNTYTNRIIDPESIADILLEGVDSGQLHPDAFFLEGEMPFFEVSNMAHFLLMKPLSKKPNCIYDIDGTVVEESFSKFIWRLYYESPTFYLDV
jgi:hypothetical protein